MTVRRLLKRYNELGSEIRIHEMDRPNTTITLNKDAVIKAFGRRSIVGWDAYISPSCKVQLELWIYGRERGF